MRHIFTALLALTASVSAYAADWRLVGDNVEMPAIIAFVDNGSVKRSDGFVEFVMIYYLEGSSEDADIGVRQERRAQCPGNGFQILSERRWLGPKEQPAKPVDQKFVNATPDSIDQMATEMACGTRAYASANIADPDKYSKDYFADLALEDEAY